MKAIEIIRLVGMEFSNLSTETLEQWIEVVRPMVSRKQFGKLYEQALAYLVCHKLKMAGHGENPLGDLGVIGVGFGIGSVSEGGSSVSFGANQSSNLAADAELGLTSYGVQYLQLRRSVIVPIHVGGEPIEEPKPYRDKFRRPVPVASETQVGGFKIRPGSGLTISEDGVLSLDAVMKPQEGTDEEGTNG